MRCNAASDEISDVSYSIFISGLVKDIRHVKPAVVLTRIYRTNGELTAIKPT